MRAQAERLPDPRRHRDRRRGGGAAHHGGSTPRRPPTSTAPRLLPRLRRRRSRSPPAAATTTRTTPPGDRLAQCESGGNWAANTGNGYYGGIQFSLVLLAGVGGTGYPHQASRETQIAMGQRLWHQGGWSHWPACTSKLGYR